MVTVHKFPEGVSNEKSEFLLAEPSDSASRLAFISIHSTIGLYNAAVPPQEKVLCNYLLWNSGFLHYLLTMKSR